MVQHWAAILIASMIFLGSAIAIEPVNLGKGHVGTSINLDAGAARPGPAPAMTGSGFVTPAVPQPMALSTSSMVHQAEKLLEDARHFREDAQELYNNTVRMTERVEEKSKMVQDLAAAVNRSEEVSSMNAAKSATSLREIEDIYNKTLNLYQVAEMHAEDIKNNSIMYPIKAYLERDPVSDNFELSAIHYRSAGMKPIMQESSDWICDSQEQR